MVDLRESADTVKRRSEFRTWLAENMPAEGFLPGDTAEGFAQVAEWERKLFAAGWAMVDWPVEYGGQGCDAWTWLALEDEYWNAGAPQKVSQNGAALLAPSLMKFGTSEQKQKLLPRMARLEDLWCQGWSEPGAGSDLAGIRSSARKVDGGWLLNGQKTWTTRGAYCSHLFGLFRTDPESRRHRGLTYFLVPLTGSGVEVRGFQRFDGDIGFADVHFDDHFVSDADVLGGVGEGWRIAMSTTASERGVSLRSPARFSASANRLLHDASPTASEAVRRQAVTSWVHARAYEHYTLHTVTRGLEGRAEAAESSVNKLMWSALDLEITAAAVDVSGDRDRIDPRVRKEFQFALAGPIYAGTNDIQRDVVAQRLLGLPRGGR